MKYTELKMHEAVNLAASDADVGVYMLQPVTKGTTIEMLSKAGGFILAEKEENAEPDKSQPGKKRLNLVDHARIVRLYTDNPERSLQSIADEVGCSPQTVLNHLNREGIYQKRGEAEDGDTED